LFFPPFDFHESQKHPFEKGGDWGTLAPLPRFFIFFAFKPAFCQSLKLERFLFDYEISFFLQIFIVFYHLITNEKRRNIK